MYFIHFLAVALYPISSASIVFINICFLNRVSQNVTTFTRNCIKMYASLFRIWVSDLTAGNGMDVETQ